MSRFNTIISWKFCLVKAFRKALASFREVSFQLAFKLAFKRAWKAPKESFEGNEFFLFQCSVIINQIKLNFCEASRCKIFSLNLIRTSRNFICVNWRWIKQQDDSFDELIKFNFLSQWKATCVLIRDSRRLPRRDLHCQKYSTRYRPQRYSSPIYTRKTFSWYAKW